jgi:uncharacterized protein YqfB (UPF0267 family)
MKIKKQLSILENKIDKLQQTILSCYKPERKYNPGDIIEIYYYDFGGSFYKNVEVVSYNGIRINDYCGNIQEIYTVHDKELKKYYEVSANDINKKIENQQIN